MNYTFYIKKFKAAAARLDKKLLRQKKLDIATGITLDSVYLKLYNKEWASNSKDPMSASSRIFFSIWVNDKTIQQKKIFYNIHALKLRHLKGYSISSRKFAEEFRGKFKKNLSQWENVSIDFGPLTLVEGWKELDIENLETIISGLANNFLALEHLIGDTLRLFIKGLEEK